MSRQALSPDTIQQALDALPDWTVREGKLHREFQFPDFNEAFGFMTAVALYAERRDHHPEWFNVYNRVVVDLSTHDVGGISQADVDMARFMSARASHGE